MWNNVPARGKDVTSEGETSLAAPTIDIDDQVRPFECAHVTLTPAVSRFVDSNWTIVGYETVDQGGECGNVKANAWFRLGIIDPQSTSGTWVHRGAILRSRW